MEEAGRWASSNEGNTKIFVYCVNIHERVTLEEEQFNSGWILSNHESSCLIAQLPMLTLFSLVS